MRVRLERLQPHIAPLSTWRAGRGRGCPVPQILAPCRASIAFDNEARTLTETLASAKEPGEAREHAPDDCRLRPHRRGERLRRARPRHRACPVRARTSSISASASPISARPTHIVEAAIKALRDGHHGYTPATGLLATREAVARRTLTTTGVEVSPEQRDDPAGRQADDVCGDPDVRRAGRRNPLSRSGLSDLPLDDRVHRRAGRCRCRSARRTASPSRPRRRCR